MAGKEWLHGEYEVIVSKADEDKRQRLPAFVSLDEALYDQRLRLQIREPHEQPMRKPPFWLSSAG